MKDKPFLLFLILYTYARGHWSFGHYSKFADDPDIGLERAVIPLGKGIQIPNGIGWVLRKEVIL
jgi:hypothetical protein